MIKEITGGITAPQGFLAAGVKAGIKKSGKEDVALIFSQVPASAAALFTTNQFAAAPVVISRKHAAAGVLQGIIVNSGCANACTGEQGLKDAETMAVLAGEGLDVAPAMILVSSTGVIGPNLPMDKIKAGIQSAVKELSTDGSDHALLGIMTTDTIKKYCAFEFQLGGKTVKLGGIAKGSGMIHPNMATMLAYVTTDAAIKPEILQTALKEAVALSFNSITVDGDTSTNDTVAVLANGMAENSLIDSVDHEDYPVFYKALERACISLAKQIVVDGEGATKKIEIQVNGAVTKADAKKAAMAVAKSPLVKTAVFGEDPNWGRILCAVGYSGSQLNPEKASLVIGSVKVVDNGMPVMFDAEALRSYMAERDLVIAVDLGVGSEAATVWTCDLSYEYVTINAEYHT